MVGDRGRGDVLRRDQRVQRRFQAHKLGLVVLLQREVLDAITGFHIHARVNRGGASFAELLELAFAGVGGLVAMPIPQKMRRKEKE